MFSMIQRVVLFFLVNTLVVLTISVVLNLLGIQPYLSQSGIDLRALAVFCFIWGGIGSLISLLMSKQMAKWTMGLKVVDPATRNPEERALYQVVERLSRNAGLPETPEVAYYNSPEVNAFATGPSKNSSLVAVSTGLLQRLKSDEVNAVLGHELSHISNGDMVTMTLLQGIVNAFVMFLARAFAFMLLQRGSDQDEGPSMNQSFAFPMIVVVLETILMFFGMLVVAAFSRFREFRADEGGARLAGRENMIAALQALKATVGIQDPRDERQQAFQSLKISAPSGFMNLFATHPPLDKRIEHLRSLTF